MRAPSGAASTAFISFDAGTLCF